MISAAVRPTTVASGVKVSPHAGSHWCGNVTLIAATACPPASRIAWATEA